MWRTHPLLWLLWGPLTRLVLPVMWLVSRIWHA